MRSRVYKHLYINLRAINHHQHRYSTLGDYYTKNGVECIVVSKMSDWRYEFLVAIHELIEFYLCKNNNISEKVITEYDRGSIDDEPGDNPNSPYHKQHRQAIRIEKIVAKMMGVNWKKYCQEIDDLFDPPLFKKRNPERCTP